MAITRETHDAFTSSPMEFVMATSMIHAELIRSCAKHPMYPRDPMRRTAIMVEEAGEALREALDLTATQDCLDPNRLDDKAVIRERLRKELIQAAAMAVKALMAMTREDLANGSR